MTQLNSTNPGTKAFIDTLCGYSNDVYLALTKSLTLSYYVGYSNISLTLVNELLHTIAETSNRKRRRATIVRLVSMFMGCNLQARLVWVEQPTRGEWMTSYTKLLADLTYNLRVQYPTPTEQSNLDSIPLRILHRDNEPWWAALVVGDSKHYTSCLRSGILRYTSLASEWNDQRWLSLLEHGCDDRGCNYSDYVHHEVAAFKAGHIMYLVAGDMVYHGVDSPGPQARMRVHVASVDNRSVTDFTDANAILIVDRMYGVNALYTRLLQLLLEQYPGRVYVNSRHDYISRSGNSVPVTLCNGDVYSDCLMEDATQITEILPGFGSEITKVRGKQVYRCSVYKGDLIFTRREPPEQANNSDPLRWNLDGYNPGIALLSSYYNVPYTWGLMSGRNPVLSYIRPGVRFSGTTGRTSWTFRGVLYELRYNYGCSECVLQCVRRQREYIYNLRTGTWERKTHYKEYWTNDYRVTRHTIKFIGKYLPKQPNTRPRKKS